MEVKTAQALDELGRYFKLLGEIRWCLGIAQDTPGKWYTGKSEPSLPLLRRIDDYLVVARAVSARVGSEALAGRWLYLIVCQDRLGYRWRMRLHPLGSVDLPLVLTELEADIKAGTLPEIERGPSLSQRPGALLQAPVAQSGSVLAELLEL